MKEKINILTYVFLAIGISPLSSSIYGHNIKLPFLLLGIVMLLGFNRGMKSIINRSLKQKKMRVMVAILIVMAVVGTLTGGDFVPVIMDFMAIFFFFLFYWENSRNEQQANALFDFIEKYFFAISIYELIVIYTGISESSGIDEIRVINLVACPFALALIYLQRNKTLLSLMFFAICTLMTIRSAMRINFLFPILYVGYLIIIVFRNKKIAIYKKGIIVGVILFATVAFFPKVQAYIEDDGSRYLHMVKRTEEMFDERDRDDTRKNTNMLIINETADFILPQGIGYANHTKRIMSLYRSRYGVMSTMDSNLLYCVYHFGLFIGLGIIIMIFYGLLKLIILNIRKLDNDVVFMATCFVIVVVSLFALKSWIFVYSSFGLIYGLLYAYAKNLIKFKS